MRKENMPLRMAIKFGLGFLIMGLILFCSAGTISYENGWIFIAALGIPMLLFGVFLLIKDPETLARRLNSKESDQSQRTGISVSGLVFLASFLLAGIDFRFHWSNAPIAVVMAGLVILLLGYGLYVVVILQNAYASRTIEVSDGQKIITSGLYSAIRHPMYTATLLIFLSMPLVLGSYFALIPMATYPVIIVRRIKFEEAFLKEQLEGYREYTQTVRFRLLPFIW